MKTTTNDGGPAFPFACQGPTTAPEIYYGMSLRDYFAAKALQGMLANPKITSTNSIVEDAIQIADELIAARESKPL